MKYLPCVEIEPKEKAIASIIWLHGLGANGHDFEPIIPELKLPKSLSTRFIFPHAPSMPVTINGGHVMPAWYDIVEMSIDRKVDTKQLIVSADAITALIDREIDRGVDSRNIIIAGFSQGGAVAYHSALTYPRPLAGILALSTYFATKNIIQPAKENRNIPILICHGTADPVVPEVLGQMAREILKGMGYKPDYKTYPMEHSVSHDEILDISRWFQAILRP